MKRLLVLAAGMLFVVSDCSGMLEGFTGPIGRIRKAIAENDLSRFRALVTCCVAHEHGDEILLAVIKENIRAGHGAALEAAYPNPFGSFWERQGDVRAEMIDWLQARDVDINKPQAGKLTPLHHAAFVMPGECYMLRAEIISRLVGRRADGCAHDAQGHTPLERFLHFTQPGALPAVYYETIKNLLEDAQKK